MTTDAYFTGKSGTKYFYAHIAARIRQEAPHTLGKHIFVQLDALGLLEEMQHGTTPYSLPLTFAESAETAEALHAPGLWAVSGDRDDCDGLSVVQQSTGGVICCVETTFGQAVADEANARRIAAAVNACDGVPEAVLKPGLIGEVFEALEDLLGDMPDVQKGICVRCGRDYQAYPETEGQDCPSEDCPSYRPRGLLRMRSARRRNSQS